MAAALATLALTTTAAAEGADPRAAAETVRERPRPAYDPLGVRVGGFLFFPSVELGASSDDNLYERPEGEKRSAILSVRPRIAGISQWRNHQVEFRAGLAANDFRAPEEKDLTNWFAGAAGRLDIKRDAWVSAVLDARTVHDERGDPDSPSTVDRPVSRQLLSAEIEGFWRVNRLSLGVEARYASLAYDDPIHTVTGRRVVQNDRNRDEGQITTRIGWALTPGHEAFVRAARYVRRYDRPEGDDRYDRDSDGTEFVAGARLDLGALLFADLFVGYRRQSYDDDERLPAVDGATYGGTLTWNVTQLTTIHGKVARTVGETALRRASGKLSTAYELGADHELLRNLLIGASIGVTTNRYVGSGREDEILRPGVEATWLVNRGLQAVFGYRFQRRDSTLDRDDYDKNVVYLNVRLQR